MSNIIKEIEAEQLKATVDRLKSYDTVKAYGKIKEGNRENPGIRRCTEDRAAATERFFHW